MTAVGVKIGNMQFIGLSYIEVTFNNGTDSIVQPSIEFSVNADNSDRVDISCYDDPSSVTSSVEFSFTKNEEMTNSDVAEVIMTFLDIEKFKPVEVEVVEPAQAQVEPHIKERHYYFTKLCTVCGLVYFKHEINEDAYNNQAGNPSVYDPHISEHDGYLQITSICEVCSG